MAVAGGEKTTLEFTPTWVVALVCFFIVFISLTVDTFVHVVLQLLKKQKMRSLVGASKKIKNELMILGFISLLLAVFQTEIGKICISEQRANAWLPCKKHDFPSTVASFTTRRRLLATASDTANYCSQKGNVPLLSVETLHQLDIFMFVLAVFHVALCVLKVLYMRCQCSSWDKYEKSHSDDEQRKVLKKFLEDHDSRSNRSRYKRMSSSPIGFTCMEELEYIALRQNFIAARDPKDPGNDFHEYIMRTLQKDFEKMIGISWYSWLLAVIYLLVNVAGWHAYFWISFIQYLVLGFILVDLESRIRQLVEEVAKKHKQRENESSETSARELIVELPHDSFCSRWPNLFGNLIHSLLFINSLELAFFCYILIQYGFYSCIMGKVGFVVPRVVIGLIIQIICTTRMLPLHAIIKSQMRLKEKPSDKQKQRLPDIEKIKMHLEKYQLDKDIKECLDELDKIKIPLEEDEMDEEEDTWIVKWIFKWIDVFKNRRNKTGSNKVAGKDESTQQGSREGALGVETTKSDDRKSIGDIEAQEG